jgi:molecular chaperone GrpE
MGFLMTDNENNNSNGAVDQQEIDTQESMLQQEVELLQGQLQEMKQKYFSLAADLENVRRRSAKEYESVRFDAYARILKPLLDIIDDFDRALASVTVEQDGLLMIRKSLEKLLVNSGVVEMGQSVQFDPEKHEAVMYVEDATKKSGEIVAFLQKGYLLDGKVLRHAKVSIAQ